MSWHGVVEIPQGTDPNDVYDLIKGIQVVGNDDAAKERDRALEVAVDLADAAITEEAFHNFEEYAWTVNISGHSNPENKPREGYVNDHLAIKIEQK